MADEATFRFILVDEGGGMAGGGGAPSPAGGGGPAPAVRPSTSPVYNRDTPTKSEPSEPTKTENPSPRFNRQTQKKQEGADTAAAAKQVAVMAARPIGFAPAISGVLAAGGPATAAVAAIAGGMYAAKTFVEKQHARATELAAFSPEIAMAQAENEMAKLELNLQAGEKYGTDFARAERIYGAAGRAKTRLWDYAYSHPSEMALRALTVAFGSGAGASAFEPLTKFLGDKIDWAIDKLIAKIDELEKEANANKQYDIFWWYQQQAFHEPEKGVVGEQVGEAANPHFKKDKVNFPHGFHL